MHLSIAQLLSKYRTAYPPELKAQAAAIKAIEATLGITLEKSHLSLTRGVLTLDIPPAARSELQFKRGVILAAIAVECGSSVVRDIR